jgi:hypothetical protein
MTTYLINHLRIPNGIPQAESLHLRTDNTISDLIFVDPVGPDFTSAQWAREIRAALAADS